MSACTKHAAKPVRGYSDCPGCEVENLRQQLAAAQAEAQKLRAEAQVLRERSAHVDRCATRLAVEKDTLAQALARVRELPTRWRAAPQDPNEPLLAMAADELDAALSQAGEQYDPLAVSDHCGERESLPLMARRPEHGDHDGALYENGKRLCLIGKGSPLNKPMPGFVLYRIADTDEHGLPVIERTADMPEGAKYRLTWIMQADAAGGEVEYTDSLPLALEANRSGAVSERIEDYRESGQEGKK